MHDIRVVLIEPHDFIRLGLATALHQYEGIQVIGEATNGFDGFNLLTTAQPDVAILDIALPEMDGIHLIRQLRRFQLDNETLAATKVVILTHRVDRASVLSAFAAGADSYCMKDTTTLFLLEAIKTTHEGNAWIDPTVAPIVLEQARKVTDGSYQPVDLEDVLEPDDDWQPPCLLTDREQEILELVVDGCNNATIANHLYITVGTVKTHIRSILKKLCARDRTDAAVKALRSGLVV